MSEPRKTRGPVESVRYRYRSASRTGYSDSAVAVRRNRTLAETKRQIERIKQINPTAFVDSDRAFSAVMRTYDALGLTGRSSRPVNARLLSRSVYPSKNRR